MGAKNLTCPPSPNSHFSGEPTHPDTHKQEQIVITCVVQIYTYNTVFMFGSEETLNWYRLRVKGAEEVGEIIESVLITSGVIGQLLMLRKLMINFVCMFQSTTHTGFINSYIGNTKLYSEENEKVW